MLLAIGSGATAGAALVDYSGLVTGTAAEHLMVEAPPLPQADQSVIGGRGKRQHDELTAEEVRAQWELLELRTEQHGHNVPAPLPAPKQAHDAVLAPTLPVGGERVSIHMPDALLPAITALPLVQPTMDAALPITVEQQRAALIVLLSEL